MSGDSFVFLNIFFTFELVGYDDRVAAGPLLCAGSLFILPLEQH
jgi:hypothetical protein